MDPYTTTATVGLVRRHWKLLAAAAAGTVAALAAAVALIVTAMVAAVSGQQAQALAMVSCPMTSGVQGRFGQWDATQMSNAATIVAVGVQRRVPAYGEVVAVATAMQESRLLDLPGGTADSLGLFQQRPSQGWGTPAQIMDPVFASGQFYTHLVAVPGWQHLPLTQAAQAVQRSAHPGAYAQWQTQATDVAAQVSGQCQPPSAAPSRAAATAIAFARAQLGKPYLFGGTGPNAFDCSGLVMMAYRAAGINIPRTSQEQWAWGPRVPPSQVQPGDLVFFAGADGTPTSPGHVGLVIGHNLMIEAYATGFPVRISAYGTPAAAPGDTVVVGFTRPWAHT